jgi:hypothetical protein
VNIKIRLAAALVAFAFAYLLSSFVAASFDITTWTTEGRAFAAATGATLGLLAFSITETLYD